MSSNLTFRPHRGKRSTAISKDIMLKEGEVYFEVPESGIGSGAGKIIMGDGITQYKDLPAFLEVGSSGGGGTVKSVNQILPDEQGNIFLNQVS